MAKAKPSRPAATPAKIRLFISTPCLLLSIVGAKIYTIRVSDACCERIIYGNFQYQGIDFLPRPRLSVNGNALTKSFLIPVVYAQRRQFHVCGET
jgi:hypothetical protein